jgi:hypothetical protein
MVSSKPLPNTFEANYSFAKTINPSVSIGNRGEAARADTTTNITSVLDVVKPITELMPVLKHRKLNALTPYKPDTWEHLLTKAGLFSEYQHIPNSLHYNFYIILNSPLLAQRRFPPIALPLLNSNSSSPILYEMKSRKATILAPSPALAWNLSLAHFNLPLFPLFPNQPSQVNTVSYKIIPSLSTYQSLSLTRLSILTLILMISQLHGVLSHLYHFYYGSYHQALRLLPGMLLKHIALSPCIPLNGSLSYSKDVWSGIMI